MKEVFVELGILLGLETMKQYFRLQINDLNNIDQFLSIKCKFFRSIRKIIRNLIQTISFQDLSITLFLSTHFLLLLTKQSKRGGHCLVCDKYCDELEIHFISSHRLSRGNCLSYKQTFGPLTESFNPVLIYLEINASKKPVQYKKDIEKNINKKLEKDKSKDSLDLKQVTKNLNNNNSDKQLPVCKTEKKFVHLHLAHNKSIKTNVNNNDSINKVKHSQNNEAQEVYDKFLLQTESEKKSKRNEKIYVNCSICHKKLLHQYIMRHMMRHNYRLNPENSHDYSSFPGTVNKLGDKLESETAIKDLEKKGETIRRHEAMLVIKEGRCVYCKSLKKSSNSTYKCISCNVYLHCITKDCFNKYHELLK